MVARFKKIFCMIALLIGVASTADIAQAQSTFTLTVSGQDYEVTAVAPAEIWGEVVNDDFRPTGLVQTWWGNQVRASTFAQEWEDTGTAEPAFFAFSEDTDEEEVTGYELAAGGSPFLTTIATDQFRHFAYEVGTIVPEIDGAAFGKVVFILFALGLFLRSSANPGIWYRI